MVLPSRDRKGVGAFSCTLLGCVVLLAISSHAQTKKKIRKPAPPQVSAAARSAASARVDRYLEASSDSPIQHAGALVPFFERLFRSAASPEHAPVHILHFGDSHTAADEWTGGLRDLFRAKFGDGGSGFSVAGHPFLGYRRFDARGGATGLWHTLGLRSANGDGYFGLGGVSIEAAHPGQSIYLDAECERLEIHYLLQPGGGALALYDNDQRVDEISTDSAMGAGLSRFDTPPGPHRFKLLTVSSKPVRLFGWVADKPAGVTYEALGINGAEASVMLKWNDEMTATYLQARNPGLIVLAYGTNEASDPNWNLESYRAMLGELLQRLRRAAPSASILLLGPDDRWARYRAGWKTVPGIDWVIEAQEAACRDNGCAYWDTRKRMGGKGSMPVWVTAGLGQPDRVHFTAPGYRRLAAVLFDDLIQQYEAFRKVRLETLETPHGQAKQDH